MEHTRKKLIEELIRVGRLIDPAPDSGQQRGGDDAQLISIAQHSDMDPRSPMEDLENLPVVEDVVDQPYTTKDMFSSPVGSSVSKLAAPSEVQQPATNKSDSSNLPLNEHIGTVATDSKKHIRQEKTTIGFPVEELARELVTLIEDCVSQRSGEQLDDTFRDELTQAVTSQLEGWLRHD